MEPDLQISSVAVADVKGIVRFCQYHRIGTHYTEDLVDDAPHAWAQAVRGERALALVEHMRGWYHMNELHRADDLIVAKRFHFKVVDELSPQEWRVCFLTGKVMLAKRVGALLDISESTAANHFNNACAKLGVGGDELRTGCPAFVEGLYLLMEYKGIEMPLPHECRGCRMPCMRILCPHGRPLLTQALKL